MYLNFYGLKEKPFNPTPDPKFLYLTPGHRDALAQLLYGVQERKGFMVLTGEMGTGKTTLLQALLQQLDGKAEVAFISHSKLPFDGIIEYIIEDFGIATTATSHVQRLFALNNFLIQSQRAGQNAVLIIDEGQNLEPPILEQVRLLSNFETPTEKLLQILLVGQPELQAKLELPELRQLTHRIGLRCSLPSLTSQETRDYIRHRLRIAGAQDLALFTDRAVRRIAGYADGNPRVVNIICDHCLLIGYAEQKQMIDHNVVEQAIKYREEGRRPRHSRGRVPWRSKMAPLRWVILASVVAILGWVSFRILRLEGYTNVLNLLSGYLHSFTGPAHNLLSGLL